MTGVSTLSSALTRISLINDQNELLNSLTTQLATGRKTQQFSGLDTSILASKRARADLGTLETYTNNIKIGDRRISQMLLAIEEFQEQAANLSNGLTQLSQESTHQEGNIIVSDDPFTTTIENTQIGHSSGEPDVDLETLQDLAGNLFAFMGDLLNTQDGERYVLGGADALTQPYTDNGILDAAISTQIGIWKDELTPPVDPTLTKTEELISALRSRTVAQDPSAMTDSIVGYSAALSAGNVGDVFVRADEKIEIEYTALANEQPFRDIMVAAAFIKSETLGPIADVYNEPYTFGDMPVENGAPGATLQDQKENFYQVLNDLTAMVNQAIDGLDSIRFRLENARVRIDEIQQAHTTDKNLLENTIDSVENVDINQVTNLSCLE